MLDPEKLNRACDMLLDSAKCITRPEKVEHLHVSQNYFELSSLLGLRILFWQLLS